MIFLMTLAQQFRRSPRAAIPTRRWSVQAVVAAWWAAAALVVVTSCGVLGAVGWVLLAPPEALPQPRAAAPTATTVARAADVSPAAGQRLREEEEF